MMQKKWRWICCGLLAAAICGTIFSYVSLGRNHVEDKMWEYLGKENYSQADIQSLEVSHSFMSILLSYDEWVVRVVYQDEPASVYFYTLKNGEIVGSGVSGSTDKEDLKHTS